MSFAFLASTLCIEESVHAAKENSVLQRRPPALLRVTGLMPRDQQLAGPVRSEDLDPHKDRSNDYGMRAIDSNGINGMQMRQRLAVWPAEGDIPPESLHRTARFDAPHNISARQMLVLEAHVRLSKDTYFVKAAQNRLWQGETSMAERTLLSHDVDLHAERRTGIGQPTAFRIISFAQPAQQMYFRGSSIEMARLSPLRSWPASAHDGHRVM